jgi:hypothetical protein
LWRPSTQSDTDRLALTRPVSDRDHGPARDLVIMDDFVYGEPGHTISRGRQSSKHDRGRPSKTLPSTAAVAKRGPRGARRGVSKYAQRSVNAAAREGLGTRP